VWRRRAIDAIGDFPSLGSNFPSGDGEAPDASPSTVDGISHGKRSTVARFVGATVTHQLQSLAALAANEFQSQPTSANDPKRTSGLFCV